MLLEQDPFFHMLVVPLRSFQKKNFLIVSAGLSFSWKILWTSSAWLKNKRKLVGLSAMGVYNQTVMFIATSLYGLAVPFFSFKLHVKREQYKKKG